ncbi:MAG: hypothetical protein ACLP1Y_01195 [Candidatus Acidiferrales bacterium]
MSWYWNEIGDKDSARYATTTAVWISYLIAIVNGLMAILSLAYHEPVNGLNGWALLDAAFVAVVGWRIAHLSRAWAVVGVFLYPLAVLNCFGTHGFAVGGLGSGIVAVVFLIAYVNAVRGTFAYHKYVKLQTAQVTEPTRVG